MVLVVLVVLVEIETVEVEVEVDLEVEMEMGVRTRMAGWILALVGCDLVGLVLSWQGGRSVFGVCDVDLVVYPVDDRSEHPAL